MKFYEQLRIKEGKKKQVFEGRTEKNDQSANVNVTGGGQVQNVAVGGQGGPGGQGAPVHPGYIDDSDDDEDFGQGVVRRPGKGSKGGRKKGGKGVTGDDISGPRKGKGDRSDGFDYSEEIVEESEDSMGGSEDEDGDMAYNDIKAGGKGKAFKLNINPNEYHYSANKYYQKYLKIKDKDNNANVVSQEESQEGKITRTYSTGKKEVLFNNGARREIYPDKYTIVHFVNSDVKQTLPDGSVIYYYAEAQTTQITLENNGLNIYRFSNNQVEFHYEDGSKEIKFADGTEKYIHADGIEETIFADGTVQKVAKDKTKTIEYPNGSRDTIYTDGRRVRAYPDGRVKQISIPS